MIYTPGMYFKTEEEADGWLDFECNEDEAEARSYAENDRYGEWQRWQQAWMDA